MSRYIDADALTARLKILYEDDWNQNVCTSWANAYSYCEELVEEQPTADVPQWIPCSERLPEKPKPNDEFEGKPLDIYLVCKKGNIPFRAFWNGKNFTDGWTSLNVDAWMPLPSPWKGEEDEQIR